MKKVLIVYTSMSGNTEMMARAIAVGIESKGVEVKLRDVMEFYSDEIDKYDGILLGSYTWGDGELPDEFLDFYEEMDGLDLTKQKWAVFGSCSSQYSYYGRAVELLEEKLNLYGANIVGEPLKIELTPSDVEEEICKQFGMNFSKEL